MDEPARANLDAAARSLGLEADTPDAIATAARQAGVPIDRLLRSLLAESSEMAAPEVAQAYLDGVVRDHAETLSDVAHDLRGPLTGMLGIIQTMRRRELPGDTVSDFLRRLESSSRRMEALIADVDTLSQLDTGRMQMFMEDVDPSVVVEEAVRTAGAEGEVTVDIAADLPELHSDHARLVLIISRMLDNAVRYASSQPRVTVTALDTIVRFGIEDDGPGIAPEHVARVSERFFQVPGDKTRGRSGLGLSVASELAGLLGGRLVVDSTLGRGSRFTLEVPTN